MPTTTWRWPNESLGSMGPGPALVMADSVRHRRTHIVDCLRFPITVITGIITDRALASASILTFIRIPISKPFGFGTARLGEKIGAEAIAHSTPADTQACKGLSGKPMRFVAIAGTETAESRAGVDRISQHEVYPLPTDPLEETSPIRPRIEKFIHFTHRRPPVPGV